MSVASPAGSKYFVIFKDDSSGYRVIEFIKSKAEVFDHFKAFVARLKNEVGCSVKTIRSDNGGEYTSLAFQQWLKEEGIRHETSVPKTPQQNGAAEREIRTIVEHARSMLLSANLPTELWAEASACAVYLLNRIESRVRPGSTPYEMWHGKKPSLAYLQVFGTESYLHIPRDERSKFESKSTKCFLVGYSETQKAYRLWDPIKKRVKVGRDVVFNEELFCQSQQKASSPEFTLPDVRDGGT